MPEVTKLPTHFRLLAAFKALGPYLREEQSKDGLYWFDCLSVCVSDKKAPEKREFWGWWITLTPSDEGFQAEYHTGRYNIDGDWVDESIPAAAQAEVERTHGDFAQKLSKMLADRFAKSLSTVE
ncbi:sigma factor-binding protein Crl [Vibrio porteresiae]|uniref:Sigma factor-binding protein Crl n=1 Tax=Vibrio porteresiae DSM 19223 TaxID=1123496 RepID=A0ABZ0QFH5_9VIBR|nr:sigma factor-binding protein Crl [Vibrio porteresiae]WPC74736.1 sigma factor-binding protein Crl [Vibrio porteresiae DSM 19223]